MRRSTQALLAVLAFCSGSIVSAQSFLIEHAGSIGGPTDNSLGDMVSDDVGNTYMTGVFDGAITMGDITLTAPAFSNTDIFIAKRGPTGDWIWAKRLASGDPDIPGSIALDGSGGLFVSCWLRDDQPTYDGAPIALENGGLVVVKLDTAGQWGWLAGTTNIRSWGDALITDEDGVVYVAGDNNPEETQVWFGTIELSSGGNIDTYLAKLSPDGEWLWAKNYFCPLFGGFHPEQIFQDMELDAGGNILIGGEFQGYQLEMDWFTCEVLPFQMDWSSMLTFYLASFSPDGELQWVRVPDAGYSSFSMFNAMDHGPDGTIHASIYYADTLSVNGALMTDELGAVLIRLDPFGAVSSVVGIHDHPIRFSDMVVNSAGRIFTMHRLGDPIQVAGEILTSTGADDLLLTELDPGGTGVFGMPLGGPGNEFTHALTLSPEGIICAGGYEQTIIIGQDTLTSVGDKDIFLLHVDLLTTGLGSSGSGVQNLIFHPNPTRGLIYLADAGTVHLFDAVGRIILSFDAQRWGNALDLSSLSAGVYVLRSRTGCAQVIKE